MRLPRPKILQGDIEIELDRMRPQEKQAARTLFNRVIAEGMTYAFSKPLTEAEFEEYWMPGDTYVVRADTELLGAFYLKPNFPGRCKHIANAGFIVQSACRNMGIGRFMTETMLSLAKQAGYAAVMFNLVFETNHVAIALWRSLGFSTIGRIPHAARLSNGQTVDALMFYRELSDIA